MDDRRGLPGDGRRDRNLPEEGVLIVDMEAAATFVVASHRDVEAGALFTVSNRLAPPDWEPRFAETLPYLRRAFDATVEALNRGE